MQVRITLEWMDAGSIRVGLDRKLEFPDQPEVEGVYRIRLDQGTESVIYIGESDKLKRRATHYRNPGPTQFTNLRLNDRARQLLVAGGTAQTALAANMALVVDGTPIPLNLAQKSHRRILENAALVAAMNSGAEQVQNL